LPTLIHVGELSCPGNHTTQKARRRVAYFISTTHPHRPSLTISWGACCLDNAPPPFVTASVYKIWFCLRGHHVLGILAEVMVRHRHGANFKLANKDEHKHRLFRAQTPNPKLQKRAFTGTLLKNTIFNLCHGSGAGQSVCGGQRSTFFLDLA